MSKNAHWGDVRESHLEQITNRIEYGHGVDLETRNNS